jgi:hypothetical protein
MLAEAHGYMLAENIASNYFMKISMLAYLPTVSPQLS